jgi:hypothetical protein
MKHVSSLVLGSAVLLAMLSVHAFSIDLDYGYNAGRDSKRGDYYVSHFSQRAKYRLHPYAQQRVVRQNSRMVLVPTSFYQGESKVIAYNYRPVFVRDRFARTAGLSGYERLGYGETAAAGRAIASFQTVTPYRLSQPAVSFRSNRNITDYRTVYSRPDSPASIAKRQSPGGLPPIGDGPRKDGSLRDFNHGPR